MDEGEINKKGRGRIDDGKEGGGRPRTERFGQGFEDGQKGPWMA